MPIGASAAVSTSTALKFLPSDLKPAQGKHRD